MGGGWFALAGRSVCVHTHVCIQRETKSSQFCYWLTDGASERPDDFIRVRRLLRYPRIRSGHQSAPHDATLTSSLQHGGPVPLYFLDPERTIPTLPTAPSVFLDLLPHPTSLWAPQASDPVGETPDSPLQQNRADSSEGPSPSLECACRPDSMLHTEAARAKEDGDSQRRAAVCAVGWVIGEHTWNLSWEL